VKPERRISGPPADRRLVRELRRRDPRAVEMIGERYGPLLRGYLPRALGDPSSAEDVLQLTMLDVWRRGPTYDPERASLTTWLLMIARPRAIDHLRRRCPNPMTRPRAETERLLAGDPALRARALRLQETADALRAVPGAAWEAIGGDDAPAATRPGRRSWRALPARSSPVLAAVLAAAVFAAGAGAGAVINGARRDESVGPPAGPASARGRPRERRRRRLPDRR
jgi:RNA polymerase sigma factor (sigma-70 family)